MNSRRSTTLFYGLTGIITSFWGSTIPATSERLSLNPTDVGIALTSLAIGGLVAMPLAGRLATNWGVGRVMRIAAPVAALALLLPAFAPTFAWLILSTSILGVSFGALNVALNLQAVAVERDLERPVISTMQGVWTLGAVVGGAAVSAALQAKFPVMIVLAGGSCILTACALCVGASLDWSAPTGRKKESKSASSKAPAIGFAPMITLGLIGAAAFVAEGAATDWAGVHAVRVLHADVGIGSLVYAVFFATMTAGRFAGDHIRRRLGASSTIALAGSVAAAGYCTVIGSGIIDASLGARIACALVGWSFAGAGMATVWPIVVSSVGALARSERTVSSITAISYGGGLVGPALIGFAAGATNLSFALIIPVLLALFVALTAPFLLSSLRRSSGLRAEANPSQPREISQTR